MDSWLAGPVLAERTHWSAGLPCASGSNGWMSARDNYGDESWSSGSHAARPHRSRSWVGWPKRLPHIVSRRFRRTTVNHWMTAQLEWVETGLLTEFHKWASPLEMRVRSHSAALRAIDIEVEASLKLRPGSCSNACLTGGESLRAIWQSFVASCVSVSMAPTERLLRRAAGPSTVAGRVPWLTFRPYTPSLFRYYHDSSDDGAARIHR